MMNLQEATMGESEPKKDRSAPKFSLSRRQKQYWGSLIISGMVGVVMALFLKSTNSLGTDTGQMIDFASSTISKSSAIIGSALYIISFITIFTLYHKGMDEQEERAYLIANTASWYFIIMAIPIWWILSRGDIAPPIDGMAIATASFIVNISVWLWKKFL
jgi:hypothetical protein